MFFLPDVLLRCMYGRFLEALFSRTLFMETVDFRSFIFFQSWASSCIDIDIVDSVVVAITVYSIRL